MALKRGSELKGGDSGEMEGLYERIQKERVEQRKQK
jgi:hypothetical protein